MASAKDMAIEKTYADLTAMAGRSAAKGVPINDIGLAMLRCGAKLIMRGGGFDMLARAWDVLLADNAPEVGEPTGHIHLRVVGGKEPDRNV